MKFRTFVSKVGNPENYIGKPFRDVNGKIVGKITNCKESDDGRYELTIDASITPDNVNTIMSFSMKGV